jgi:hypothetical protein
MTLRKSTLFLMLIALNLLLCGLLLVHAQVRGARAKALSQSCRQLVKELRLSDLCLFTEARYTRHLAMADRHAPFQDHPMALEHFPSGSLVSPPLRHREAP